MQIPAEYGGNYLVLAVSVGLATIGVCVFSAVASVAALFIYAKEKNDEETPISFMSFTCHFYDFHRL